MSWPSTDFELAIQTELEFLRYFYILAGEAYGSSELHNFVKTIYLAEGNELPEGYE